ncbi:N-terminal methylation [Nautilia profundicola AmH]|uniref:N-terminal methylation n=1 Tax=Nautilia profundicola (strain ATCC BAA-1463 / DSM 18972 / AmH) TaxID=598659 RepID=B9LA71_NAUPA|nr:type II secretion system protein [Nautilia profundicola]ACM92488.1 N-terminal methylation [Nautilia profundicola AmH]
MKKAFTMIELIFVIVILGILAAVALPKFLGVAQQAHEGNLKSFVGTLNRTVAPTLWSKSIAENKGGDISYLALDENNITEYVELPKEVDTVNLADCNSTTADTVVIQIKQSVAGKDYVITCKDGNANQSPVFKLYRCDNTNADTDCNIANGTNIADVNTTANPITEIN